MGWRGFGPWKRELRSFLELFALTGVAVAQPAFDLLTDNASLMVTLRTTGAEALALTALLLLVPPVVLWAVEVLVGLAAPRARPYAHAALAALVATVIAVEVLKHQFDLRSAVLIALGAAIGLGLGVLVLRVDAARLWLRYLAIAPPIFAVMFLLSEPVSTAVFAGGPGAVTVRVRDPQRVVMIVLDELPEASLLDGSGQIDEELFPNFAALAADSTWYRNATTVAPHTEVAVPAILTGDYPTDSEALPVAETYPRNLFTLLGRTYDLNVHESVTQLCPRDLCGSNTRSLARYGLPPLVQDTVELWRGFASPGRDPAPMDFDASSIAGASMPVGDEFVASLKPSDEPRLDFMHILLPHQPWHLRPDDGCCGAQDDERRGEARGLFGGAWVDQWSAISAQQRHRLQLQATDQLLGRVTDKLRRIGAYEDSVIVLTADHGVAFGSQQPERGISAENWPDIMWVPLFVKDAQQREGRVDDRPVASVDVLPTLTDLLAVQAPWRMDGRSALGRARRDGRRRIMDWDRSHLHPAGDREYMSVDGPKGFATVMRAGSPAASDDPLAIYRLGPFGALVGRPVEPLVDAGATPARAFVDGGTRREGVRPEASDIPWAYVQGRLDAPHATPLAIAVNGVVAGTTGSVGRGPFRNGSAFWATVAPSLFRPGENDLAVYQVTGTPAAPRLVPTRVRN